MALKFCPHCGSDFVTDAERCPTDGSALCLLPTAGPNPITTAFQRPDPHWAAAPPPASVSSHSATAPAIPPAGYNAGLKSSPVPYPAVPPRRMTGGVLPGPRINRDELFNNGFELFKKFSGGFIGFTLLALVISFVVYKLLGFPWGLHPIIWLVLPFTYGGMIRVALRLARGKQAVFADFFNLSRTTVLGLIMGNIPLFFAAYFPSILMRYNFKSGFVAAHIPSFFMDYNFQFGIIFYVMIACPLLALMLFMPFLIVDLGMEPGPAWRSSRAAARPRLLALALLVFCFGALLLIGSAMAFLGLIFALPLVVCTTAHLFLQFFETHPETAV